jgi:hypothetical protein
VALAPVAQWFLEFFEVRRGSKKRAGVNNGVNKSTMLQKAQQWHGEWLPWLRDHCDIAGQSSLRYF